ncbi:DUF29 domain-containing protein [Aerophototrophica crusticola]|uniref:DUF29 domain-containing protein n=2 Tax=Aerophototrophica crusticola TaxID=1709002 RepID=A0A858RCP7_9PROT|nr:DUF29 domain-containing protein [Rhodospirillaceae bacterium B3]
MIRKDKPLYEADGYAWYMEQARLIREGRLHEADLSNIAEELEDMGRSEAAKLRSMLRLILLHLLKWKYQPQRRARSWAVTIGRERVNVPSHMRANPSLKSRIAEDFAWAYDDARQEAAVETGLPIVTFPKDCPFTLDQTLQQGWMPEDGDSSR